MISAKQLADKLGVRRAPVRFIVWLGAASQALRAGRQEAAGKMFWLTRKRFFGSYFVFTDTSRL